MELMHYGVGHENGGHSGRYPWGSGEDPYQRNLDWKANNQELIKQGLNEKERAIALGYKSVEEYRLANGRIKDEIEAERIARVVDMINHGDSNTHMAEVLDCSEGTIRNIRKRIETGRQNKTDAVAEELKTQLLTKEYLDVGAGSNLGGDENGSVADAINVSDQTMKKALQQLKEEGYEVYNIYIPQATNPRQKTTVQVLCPPGTPYGAVMNNIEGIKPIQSYFPDYSTEAWHYQTPKSMDSSRVYIDYGDEHGENVRDGVIELRRGVEDISLGESRYSQVRIRVDDKYYMKGMAIYSDDIPDGYDVVYHTNKKAGTPVMNPDPNGKSVMKQCKLKADGTVNEENPFGATVMRKGQREYIDEDGNTQLSLINKINDEGTVGDWSKTIASQMLSKQPQKVIDTQLKLSIQAKQSEFDEICALTNPTVKRKLLLSYADDCDGNSVDLKAIAFPRQTTKYILPVPSLKENEIYAPHLEDGTEVCLIRYPHQGTFEIPQLKVNNSNPEGKKVVGPLAKDAVGINYKTAAQLSGADFDGDTVVVIPLSKDLKLTATKYKEELKNFNPKEQYPEVPGMKVMTSAMKGKKMGEVTNLITDMTLQGATGPEIVRAVKHSMVVIDAEKHRLNYEESYKDNGIAELKDKYQRQQNPDGSSGSATLISKAKSPKYVNARKQWNATIAQDKTIDILDLSESQKTWYTRRLKTDVTTLSKYTDAELKDLSAISGIDISRSKNGNITLTEKGSGIDPATGKKVYKEESGYKEKKLVGIDEETGKKIYEETGKIKYNKQSSTKMAETDDAMTLVSNARAPQELAYANYANKLKSLANQARKEYIATGRLEYSPSANKAYKKEVEQLESDLMVALKNAPKERQAQITANVRMGAIVQDDPSLKDDDKKYKKKAQQVLNEARAEFGATKKKIVITEKEWEAIQAGAISDSKLSQILDNADMDSVRKLATPRATSRVSATQEARIRAFARNGHTLAEICDYLKLPESAVSAVLTGM